MKKYFFRKPDTLERKICLGYQGTFIFCFKNVKGQVEPEVKIAAPV